MQITPNFSRGEFLCPDGTSYPCKWIDSRLWPLCKILEKIRAKVGKPIVITSGYRTAEYNAGVKGAAPKSLHIEGKAVDFKVKGIRMSGRVLYALVEQMIKDREIPDGGLGSYRAHVHYDLRSKPARWKK